MRNKVSQADSDEQKKKKNYNSDILNIQTHTSSVIEKLNHFFFAFFCSFYYRIDKKELLSDNKYSLSFGR